MIMDHLEYCIIKYGTPSYLFDIDKMKDTVGKFREALGGKAGLCFAMKANPFLTKQMETQADRLEVCSMGEFRICKKQGIAPEKLLISGVLKEKEDVYEILDTYGGRCTYTIESLDQYQSFADWCGRKEKPVPVYLRLTSGNQFGMDEETIYNIIKIRDMCPYLNILGIHYFSGTQKKHAGKIKEELDYLDQFLRKMEERTGFQLEQLEYGPGLSVPYFRGQEDHRDSDLNELVRAVEGMEWKGSVMLEMGRALAADCGYYLTSVKDIKQSNGRRYCIVDGGIHHLNYDGQIRGMYEPVFRVWPEKQFLTPRQEQNFQWTVCGSLCTVNDVLMQKAQIRNLKAGNVLIFERAGAYAMTEGMALFLSHELPKVLLYSREMGWNPVRERIQTYHWNTENL
ncbi:alanine racemase [Lachnospiraceae bacterium 29-91]